MTEIIYVDKKMKVIKRRNTERIEMDWWGGIHLTIYKAELIQHFGVSVFDFDDHDRHPSLKMRKGKLSARRELILYAKVKEDYFKRKDKKERPKGYSNDNEELYTKEQEEDFDLNRFQNRIVQLYCSGYAGQFNQFNMFGRFYCSEEGLSMLLDLPDDILQFLYRNKKQYDHFDAWFSLHRKWAFPEAPEDFEEPYYVDHNNFNAEVTNCAITFTDEFGNKKEKKTQNKSPKQKTVS